MHTRTEQLRALDRLLSIMDELRAQCPWDQKQTLESLRQLTIEEVYELGDAILSQNHEEIKNELGDLLLHIVFYAKIGSETQSFDITKIANAICDKLIARHPHIYGDVTVKNADEVKQNWEKLKLKEAGRSSVFHGLPKSLPALVKATRIQEKAAGVGFDWEEVTEVFDKVKEEIEELQVEVQSKNTKAIEEEFGDLLFSLVNYARFLNISPENALEQTNRKFISRFRYIEQQAKLNQKQPDQLSIQEMEVYWEEAKKMA